MWPSIMNVRVVTGLKEGEKEYRNVVAPVFASLGIEPPVYVDNLEAALDILTSLSALGAAVINTPTGMHYTQASRCILRGVDTYVERPIAAPTDNLPSLIEAAESAGVILFTGVQRRLERPFQYLYEAAVHRREFGKLAAIRCRLAAGMSPTGWRTRRDLAGGGVLLDSGNHLLDLAVWILKGTHDSVESASIRYVHLDSTDWVNNENAALETSASGHVESSCGVNLYFDFSYLAPQGSVYESVELIDTENTRVRLVRDQPRSSGEPGLITHQRSDGSIVAVQYEGQRVLLHNAQLSNKPNISGPLLSFLTAREQVDDIASLSHPCSAASAMSTWFLTKEIYRHARKSSRSVGDY